MYENLLKVFAQKWVAEERAYRILIAYQDIIEVKWAMNPGYDEAYNLMRSKLDALHQETKLAGDELMAFVRAES